MTNVIYNSLSFGRARVRALTSILSQRERK
jgi:hypothetical protein